MEVNNRKMTISQLTQQAGVNTQTIRYYERRNLVTPESRSPAGYRYYSLESLKRVRFIKQAKEIGFQLEDISTLLEFRTNTPNQCKKVAEQVEEKLVDVKRKIKTLATMEKRLKKILESCRNNEKPSFCPMIETLGRH